MPTAAKKGTAKAAAAKAPAATTPAKSAAAAGDDLAVRFERAAAAAKQTKKRPDNGTLLKLYAHYKQATEGDVSGARPGAFDFVAGAKYDAWSKLKGTTAADAMTSYIKLVERLNRD